MLFIGINLENGAGSQYNNHLHQRLKSISLTSRGFLRDELLCAKRLGYGGWAEKLGSVLSTSLYRLAPWTSADFVKGWWGFFYHILLSVSYHLSFIFLLLSRTGRFMTPYGWPINVLCPFVGIQKRSRLKEFISIPTYLTPPFVTTYILTLCTTNCFLPT